jgi:hypothetical protein
MSSPSHREYESPDSSWLREAPPSTPRSSDPVSAQPRALRPLAAPAGPSRPLYPAPYPAPPSIPQAPRREPDEGGGMAVAAMVLGIVSVSLALFSVCDFPFGIIGIVLGILGLRSVRRPHIAKAGLALSSIGLVMAIGATVFYVFTFSAH